ncbi:Helitron helicase [Phytophthora megakarya]|uniref:ATP-dependent DNA helicase n=1 Tax=Phytophthora megakarya TaxID=4795 RepID=A0A225VBR8_9STRA|nr:Helitron helicase [Phytophthora megakarya]
MDSDRESFGGKAIIFSEDHRQILSVLRDATRAETLKAYFNASALWRHLKQVRLFENMCFRTAPDPDDAVELPVFLRFCSNLALAMMHLRLCILKQRSLIQKNSVVGDFALVVIRYELVCGYGSMDHCDAIPGSFRKVRPDIKLLNYRKWRQKKGLLNREQENDEAIKPLLDLLKRSRREDQFFALSNTIIEIWRARCEVRLNSPEPVSNRGTPQFHHENISEQLFHTCSMLHNQIVLIDCKRDGSMIPTHQSD